MSWLRTMERSRFRKQLRKIPSRLFGRIKRKRRIPPEAIAVRTAFAMVLGLTAMALGLVAADDVGFLLIFPIAVAVATVTVHTRYLARGLLAGTTLGVASGIAMYHLLAGHVPVMALSFLTVAVGGLFGNVILAAVSNIRIHR